MFKTKICGVTTLEDAHAIAKIGCDAIGLNFYEKSKRYVSREIAETIVMDLPRTVKRVGVFVNASSSLIREIAEATSLDFVQLHGDEPPEFLDEISDLKIIRAFRCKDGLGPVREYLYQCDQSPVAVLVDAYDPNEFGGTGKTLHWPDLANAAEFIGDLPLILAGGLTPANVAEAIKLARPHGVDTASGVESAPGVKDSELSSRFVAAANSAFSG